MVGSRNTKFGVRTTFICTHIKFIVCLLLFVLICSLHMYIYVYVYMHVSARFVRMSFRTLSLSLSSYLCSDFHTCIFILYKKWDGVGGLEKTSNGVLYYHRVFNCRAFPTEWYILLYRYWKSLNRYGLLETDLAQRFVSILNLNVLFNFRSNLSICLRN